MKKEGEARLYSLSLRPCQEDGRSRLQEAAKLRQVVATHEAATEQRGGKTLPRPACW